MRKEIEKAKKPGKVGRPKGTAGILNDYRARMLARPESEYVLNEVFRAATDPEHPHFVACSKMIMDRVLPIKGFEQDIAKSGGTSGVTVKIESIGGTVTIGADNSDSADSPMLSSDDNIIEGELDE